MLGGKTNACNAATNVAEELPLSIRQTWAEVALFATGLTGWLVLPKSKNSIRKHLFVLSPDVFRIFIPPIYSRIDRILGMFSAGHNENFFEQIIHVFIIHIH